jgi:hypothetical protein
MCGIGTRKVKLFLNKKVKKGDSLALFFRTALELEDANISAKKYYGDYRRHYYDKKEELLQKLIVLSKDNPNIVYGYQNHKTPVTSQIIYFELPNYQQISFHCNLKDLNNLPKYNGKWDEQENSTLQKIELAIQEVYGDEIKQRYCA